MKKLILLLLFAILQTGFAQWEQCNNGIWGGNVIALGTNENGIFAGTQNGVFFSSDGGNTWTERNNGITNRNVSCMEIMGSTIYIGISSYYDGGIYISTDNGLSWINRSNGLTNADIRTICLQGDTMLAGASSGSIYMSANKGKTWDEISKHDSNNSLPECTDIESIALSGNRIHVGTTGKLYYTTDLGATWTNEDINEHFIRAIIKKCDNKLFALTSSELKVSSDNGNTWKNIKPTPEENTYFTTLAVCNYTIYIGTYSGELLYSTDGGTEWLKKGCNILKSRITSVAEADNTIFIGTISNGVQSIPLDGDKWSIKNTGLSSYSVKRIVKCADKIHLVPFEHYFNLPTRSIYESPTIRNNSSLYRSADNCKSWQKSVSADSNYIINDYFSNNDKIFHSGYKKLFFSTNCGEEWTKTDSAVKADYITVDGNNFYAVQRSFKTNNVMLSTDNGLTWQDREPNWNDEAFTCIGVKDGRVLAGTERNGVLYSDDSCKTWTQGSMKFKINAIAFLDNVIFIGTGDVGVLMSSDNGANWYYPAKAIKDANITCFATTGNAIFAGTQTNGVYASYDSGKNWVEKNSGMYSKKILSLYVIGDEIYAGTSGGGFYRSKLNYVTCIEDKQISEPAGAFAVYPNPATDKLSIICDGFAQSSKIEIFTMAGLKVMEQNIGSRSTSVDVSALLSGVYFVKCGGAAKMFVVCR